MKHSPGRSGCSAEVELQGPLDVPASVDIFRRFGDDRLDRWDGETLLRSVRVAGEVFGVAARVTGTVDKPRLHVTVRQPHHLDAATDAASRWFVTIPHATLQELTRHDKVIAAAEQLQRGVRPVRQLDVLTALVRSVSAQQINLRFASTVRARLAERYGTHHQVDGHDVWSLDAQAIASATAADLRALQFTTRKGESIVGIASAHLGGSLDAEQLDQLDDEQFIARLVTLKGIGRWTAEWLLARTLGRPVVVAGDLGVRKAVGNAYCDGRMPTEQEVRELTRHWGDAAGVAQQLLLHVLLDDRWEELRELSAAAGP